MNNQRQLITGLLSAVSVIALGIASAQAVDIRDDEFGNNLDTDPNNNMFLPVVRLSVGCTGTLIDRHTILTAAHCVVDSGTDTDITTLTSGNISFRQDGNTTLGNDGVWAMSSAMAMSTHDNPANEDDVAIVTLDLSVTDIEAQILGTVNPSVGDLITITGYGASGTGTNPGVTTDGQRRFATNLVDAVVAKGSGHQIRFDFDDPLGDPTATAFEGGSNSGDSGGPMFVPDGVGGWIQVGITRGGGAGYGSTSDYTSVPSFLTFIDSNRGLVFSDAAAGDGNWTDAGQWTSTIFGSGADYVTGLAPDNYDEGAPLLQEDVAKYFDVVIAAEGTKTIEDGDDLSVDTFRLNHADATLLIEAGALFKAVLGRVPLFTAGIDYAGILLDQGTLDNDGEVETPVYTQNGGLAKITGSLTADDLILNGGTLTNDGTGTVKAIRFIQTGGLLIGGPEIQLDPVTGALLPGQDVDGFVGATFSALAPGGTINALGADGIDVLGGGGAN